MATDLTVAAPPAFPPARDRLESVDMLRGLVIVLMALDHVRDFFSDRLFMDPTNLATTTPALFLTRWITHYCAPVFIFLAGAGAFLARGRWPSRSGLAWFLVTRGLWLVFLELTLVRASWMFNWDLYDHGPGVFWAIGWSMVVLAGLVFLPTPAVAFVGVVMIAGHNLLDGFNATQLGLPEWLWIVLHQPGRAPVVGSVMVGTGYCLVPWCGVMAVGYGFGALLRLEPGVRRRWLFGLGAGISAAFVLLRAVNVYGDPRPFVPQSSALWNILAFLNCTKYPPSLLFLLMTLGPAILLLALCDRPLGPLAQPLMTFGRVPLFFYLLHIPLIHGAAVLCDVLRFGSSPQAADGPWIIRPGMVPEDYGVSLPIVYFLWVVLLVLLYPPCRWFAAVKRRYHSVWLSYL
jgi:uncharacterized membrane protein